jgi:Xaa-Pro aminopeptidase
MELAGESASSKIGRIRAKAKECGAEAVLVSMLDEVAWTLNLRGSDIDYNPVFVSYLLITADSATLYINPAKVNAEVSEYLKAEGVGIQPYADIESALRTLRCAVLAQPDKTNYAAYSCIANPVAKDCPVSTMKIMKNEAEIRGYHSAMLKDGLAMVKWMKWLIPAVEAGGQTELSLDEKLYACRAEQPLFRGVSFASIMGYAAHGAIVHYEPTPETDVPVEPKGLLLIDSGGQYQDGTTDITRTIPLGPLTWEERRDYTLVLRGFINLGRAVFPRGTYGTQLDALARTPMWRYGINYLHGTGHGVGSFMNVHEGPHQFRMNYMPTPLLPGMTITDEPGIYIAGSHGVRHENTMLVVPADFSDKGQQGNEGLTFGPYYTFEHLTLCPIFTSPILLEMMEREEIEWFNAYQQMVYDKLSPHLDEEHRLWLKEITKPI